MYSKVCRKEFEHHWTGRIYEAEKLTYWAIEHLSNLLSPSNIFIKWGADCQLLGSRVEWGLHFQAEINKNKEHYQQVPYSSAPCWWYVNLLNRYSHEFKYSFDDITYA